MLCFQRFVRVIFLLLRKGVSDNGDFCDYFGLYIGRFNATNSVCISYDLTPLVNGVKSYTKYILYYISHKYVVKEITPLVDGLKSYNYIVKEMTQLVNGVKSYNKHSAD